MLWASQEGIVEDWPNRPNRACAWGAADLQTADDLQTAARSPALHVPCEGPGQHPSMRHLKHADFLGRKAEVKKLESGSRPPRSRADTAKAWCPTHI